MDGSNSVMTERINLMHAAPSLSTASPPATPRRHRISGKRLLLAAAGLSVLTGAGSYGWRWWTDGRFTVDTDDAFVQADMVGVSSRVAGQVAEVLVGDNQPVRRGDVLLRLDDRDLARRAGPSPSRRRLRGGRHQRHRRPAPPPVFHSRRGGRGRAERRRRRHLRPGGSRLATPTCCAPATAPCSAHSRPTPRSWAAMAPPCPRPGRRGGCARTRWRC